MGLFDKQPIDPLEQAAQQLKSQTAQAFAQLQMLLTQGSKLFFNYPGKSPQEVADAFGTDAAAMYEVAQATWAFLQQISGKQLPNPTPDGYTVTPNQDGTVTITKA